MNIISNGILPYEIGTYMGKVQITSGYLNDYDLEKQTSEERDKGQNI